MSNGFIEFEIEYPNESLTDVSFTQSKNSTDNVYFKIVGLQTETAQDTNLAPLHINGSVVSIGHNVGNQILTLRDWEFIGNINIYLSSLHIWVYMSLLPVRITLDIEAGDTFNLNVIQLISINKKIDQHVVIMKIFYSLYYKYCVF